MFFMLFRNWWLIMGQNLLSIIKENPKVTFGSLKMLRKEKNVKENDFFMFDCLMKNIKENQI